MKFIETSNLIFKYRTYVAGKEKPEEKTVLNQLNLSVRKGAFVGILGRNGSGKSTLARQLAALLSPTEGAVCVNGLDTSREENILPVRKTAGIVFQNPDNQLIGNVVEEDVAFGPENLGVPTEEIKDRVMKALQATGMSAYQYASPQTLSGGQKQKVAISGILAMEPSCLVLDEPTAMLDPIGREEVQKSIQQLHREKGMTLIYITHHVEEVRDADYIYLMDQGRIAAEGTPEQVWQQEKLLKMCGVRMPFLQRLTERLCREGVEIPVDISSEEELITYLHKLMQEEPI